MKGWKITKAKALEADKEKIENAPTSTVETKIKKVQSDIKLEEPSTAEMKTSGAMDKKKLPKIILVTYDKEGHVQHREYTCAEVTIYENSETRLAGCKPTTRKDAISISIEARVVEVS